MKPLFFLSLLLISSICHAQEFKIDSVTKRISYEDVVSVPLNSIEILKLAKKWAISVYGAGKDMIDYYDENDKLLIIKPVVTVTTRSQFGKGWIQVITLNKYTFYYKLEVETKDNKYRVIADNFLCSLTQETNTTAPASKKDKVDASEMLFFDEASLRAGARLVFSSSEKKQEEYVEMVRKEKLELQSLFDSNLRDTFSSLKNYISKPPKKDW